jgi:Spherulation-specific family 4
VTNPGTIADTAILSQADQTVIFENSYANYASQLSAVAALSVSPDSLVWIMYSMPEGQLSEIVKSVEQVAGSIFLTDLTSNYYQSFSSNFENFVDAME